MADIINPNTQRAEGESPVQGTSVGAANGTIDLNGDGRVDQFERSEADRKKLAEMRREYNDGAPANQSPVLAVIQGGKVVSDPKAVSEAGRGGETELNEISFRFSGVDRDLMQAVRELGAYGKTGLPMNEEFVKTYWVNPIQAAAQKFIAEKLAAAGISADACPSTKQAAA